MAPRTKKQQLKVVFDTNVLFTQVASDLLRAEVADLISKNATHADLQISWHLPAVVRDERQYQMAQRAFELLPSIEKLERVLGHQLGISGAILDERINGIIEKQIQQYTRSSFSID